MSRPLYSTYKHKELDRRGIPLNTVITPDNCSLLLTKDSLRNITNHISQVTNKKFTPNEVNELLEFISNLPPEMFFGTNLENAQKSIVVNFLNKHNVNYILKEQQWPISVVEITKLNEVTPYPTIDEYQKKELKQLSRNESEYKYQQFGSRIGNAIIDRDKMDGHRSVPDGYPPGKKISPEEMTKNTHEVLNMVRDFLDPESINQIIGRLYNFNTFDSISLPHQTIPIDSKNRLLSNTNPIEYSWNINYAGQPGESGDIQVQDTITQVVQMHIESFWMPKTPSIGNYYQRIRMFIKEFTNQSTWSYDFIPSAGGTQPIATYFHFELNVTKIENDRVLLTPVNPIYTFRKPIAQVNTITIIFYTPILPLTYVPDRDTYTITFANPTQFTLVSGTNNLSTGDLVYIMNANTTSSTINTLLNSASGYFITKLSNTQFTIPVDTSSLTGTETNVTVYYGSKRIFFPLEFTSLEQ